MENRESPAPKSEPYLTGPGKASAQRPLTAAQAGALFVAAEPAFRTGSSTSSREWQPPRIEDLQAALPQYDSLEFMARGGMGAVYKARQPNLSRTVAIKVLPPEIANNDLGFADRFTNEARAMARLSHPNIVTVYEAGNTPDGLLYFVMEFVEGSDVARLIAEKRTLEPRRALEIAGAVCAALTAAHEEGIIHRDVKPSNIILDKRDRVKVADFGLAKAVLADATLLTHSEMAIGTPDFAAPELRTPGMKVDQRADIYALGVTLYQMLTGQIPRGRFQPPSHLVPRAGPRLDRIVDKALQSDPGKRYSTAVEMKRDLDRVLQSFPPTDSPPRKSRWLKIALSLAALAAVAVMFWLPSTRPDPAPDQPSITPSKGPPPKRSPRSTPEGKAEAVWESRWHKPGRLRAAGMDMNAKPFDLNAAEAFADFVQVFVLDRGPASAISWVGLRANGKVVWSDGTLEAGRIGIVRSGSEVQSILYGARVEPPAMAPPPGPITDFLFGRVGFLPGKPMVIAYADLAGAWHVDSPAFDTGLMPKPDLATPPKVTKVVVDVAGIGVLREDGSLRIWNPTEMRLPDTLAKGIRAVLPMGNSWAVLNSEGKVLNFAMIRQGATGPEFFSEPPDIREFLDSGGAAVALASGGYSPLVKHADGHWTTAPALTLISETLTKLHGQNNQSFSAFHSNARQGIMWIEPAE